MLLTNRSVVCVKEKDGQSHFPSCNAKHFEPMQIEIVSTGSKPRQVEIGIPFTISSGDGVIDDQRVGTAY
jgi:hypothetical protein